MKYLLCSLFLMSSSWIVAQITFEHQFSPSDPNYSYQLSLVQIDDDEYVYATVVDGGITLYDMDYQIVESIVIPDTPGNGWVYYITRSMFDCDDSNIEYMLASGTDITNSHVYVFRSDGTELFHQQNASVNGIVTAGPTNAIMSPIMKTPDGTKMFIQRTISWHGDDGLDVYGLCGDLPSSCCSDSEGPPGPPQAPQWRVDVHSPINNNQISPNPTRDYSTIELSEPIGANGAELMIYNSVGNLVSVVSVSPGQDRIMVNLSDQASGIYVYSIKTDGNTLPGGKIVKK